MINVSTMSGTRRWIFYFQFRSLFHCWDIVGRHWHLAGTVWYCSPQKTHQHVYFWKNQTSSGSQKLKFLEISRCQTFFCLSGSGFIQDHHVWIFPHFDGRKSSFFHQLNRVPSLDDLWKELDSLTILKLVGLRLCLLGVLGVLFFILV